MLGVKATKKPQLQRPERNKHKPFSAAACGGNKYIYFINKLTQIKNNRLSIHPNSRMHALHQPNALPLYDNMLQTLPLHAQTVKQPLLKL